MLTNSVGSFAVNPSWGVLIADIGIEPSHVLRRAGLPKNLLSQVSAVLTPQEYFNLWRALEQEAGNADLPIMIGNALSVEAFDPLLFAATCSPNLNMAAQRIAKHKQLIGPISLEVTQSASQTTLRYLWPQLMIPPAVFAMTELIFWVAFARIATRAKVKPLRVQTLELPKNAAAYQEYLGVMVEQGAPPSISFSATDSKHPFLTSNEGMWNFFEPELQKRLSELKADATMAEQVRAVLLELLPAGAASSDSVACKLRMSTRTLQRRLKQENTSFQALLNNTRQTLAEHYFTKSTLPIVEISFLLGYEDSNSFYRAFRNWTGKTPEQARVALKH